MKYVFSIVFVLMAACGQPPAPYFRPDPPSAPDADVAELVEEFYQDAEGHGIYAVESITFVDGFFERDKQILGTCSVSGNRRWVQLSRAWWDVMGEPQRRLLIYHELGHCALDLDHAEGTVNGWPMIMSPYMSISKDPTPAWSSLVNQLFSRGV